MAFRQHQLRPRFRGLRLLMIAAIVLLSSAPASSQPRQDQSQGFVTANGYLLQQNTVLPVYRFMPVFVDPEDTTLPLAQSFDQIYARQPIDTQPYLGLPRHTVANSETNSLLTQYGATGGFYAFNLDNIAPETNQGSIDPPSAEFYACNFLIGRSFMDEAGVLLINGQYQDVVAPDPNGCESSLDEPLYSTSLIQAATIEASAAPSEMVSETVGIVVQVPMFIPFGQAFTAQQQPPQTRGWALGGAGGHLSLLFTTTETLWVICVVLNR